MILSCQLPTVQLCSSLLQDVEERWEGKLLSRAERHQEELVTAVAAANREAAVAIAAAEAAAEARAAEVIWKASENVRAAFPCAGALFHKPHGERDSTGRRMGGVQQTDVADKWMAQREREQAQLHAECVCAGCVAGAPS